MMNVAMMGPALHATFMDVERTLHQVPNSVGENHCKIVLRFTLRKSERESDFSFR